MRTKNGWLMVVAIVAVALAPAAGLACDKDAPGAETAGAAGCSKMGCPKSAATAATLAQNADSGCTKSAAALAELAQGASCPKTQALAAKAAAGDQEAMTALIAIYKPAKDDVEIEAAMATDGEPSLPQLAAWAEQGCEKSMAALIAAAKSSGSEKNAELASAAEGGCQHSKAALITTYSQPATAEAKTDTAAK